MPIRPQITSILHLPYCNSAHFFAIFCEQQTATRIAADAVHRNVRARREGGAEMGIAAWRRLGLPLPRLNRTRPGGERPGETRELGNDQRV